LIIVNIIIQLSISGNLTIADILKSKI